jgi:hypothetical protein
MNNSVKYFDVLGSVRLSSPPTRAELEKLKADLLNLVSNGWSNLFPQAAEFMNHFLTGDGSDMMLDYTVFTETKAGKRALDENKKRIEKDIKRFIFSDLKNGETKTLTGYWDSSDSSSLLEDSMDMYLSVKGFTLTSYYKVVACRRHDDYISFSGTADQLFWDYYDFNAGTSIRVGGSIGELPEDYLIAMTQANMARNFFSRAEAHQTITGAGHDGILFNSFERIWGDYEMGLDTAKDVVVAKDPNANRPKIPAPKNTGGGWDW